MANEKPSLLGQLRDITNPTVTTVVEFEPKSTMMLGGVLGVVIVLAILIWAVARKMSNPG